MLDDLQARHLARVHDYLVQQIVAAGWLSFERFMDIDHVDDEAALLG